MSDPMENGQNDPEDIEYGLRRSRRSTSYEYRDSSTLTPAQIMEQEVYYESAEITTNLALQTMHIVCTLLPLFHRYNAILLVLQFSQPVRCHKTDPYHTVRRTVTQIAEHIYFFTLLYHTLQNAEHILLLYCTLRRDLRTLWRHRQGWRPLCSPLNRLSASK